MTDILCFDDLSSTVYLGEMHLWAAAELPHLYHSMYSTAEYACIYDEAEDIGTCVLDDPDHVIMFTLSERDAVALNRVFDIEPASADRFCGTFLRAFPSVSRVRLEVMFEPSLLSYLDRILVQGEDNMPTHTLSICRSRRDRMLALDEVPELGLRRLRRGARKPSRPGIRTAIRRLTKAPSGDGTSRSGQSPAAGNGR